MPFTVCDVKRKLQTVKTKRPNITFIKNGSAPFPLLTVKRHTD
jgi:hypothetical protein